VLRGGSWNNNANNCRSANRNNNDPSNRNNNNGFRLASTRMGAGTGPLAGGPGERERVQGAFLLTAVGEEEDVRPVW
jgi:hypothetical protein